MTEKKNLIKELREIELDRCNFLGDFTGKKCEDFDNCKECRKAGLNAIADRIEEEFAPKGFVSPDVNGFLWPCFEDGTPIQRGDKFVSNNGRLVPLTSITFSTTGEVELNALAYDEGNHFSLDLGEEEYIPRPKTDSLEKIREDAKRPPWDYCVEILGWSKFKTDTALYGERVAAMVADLLDRQCKILEQ